MKIIGRRTIFEGFVRFETITFRRRRSDGTIVDLEREVADAGDAAVILPYDPDRRMVLLIRQFRCVKHMREGGDGLLIEAIAGKLEGLEPDVCARKEAEEEAGVRLTRLEHLFDAYATPGSYAERLSYFIAPYSRANVVSQGGGLAHEEEDIEVLEIPLERALDMIGTGEIVDSKTIVLLLYMKAMGIIDRG